MLWTDERVDELKMLWATELSCSEIGAAMKISRNAVIGKVHRLGLPLRGKPKPTISAEELARLAEMAREANRIRMKTRRANGYRAPSMQTVEIKPLPEYKGALNIPYNELRDFSSSAANQCRYIAGEVTGADPLACGVETVPGASYCEHCGPITRGSYISLSETDKLKRRAHFIRIGNASKHGRTLNEFSEDAA